MILPTFRLFNCFSNIHCYSTSFRVWHQVTWSRTRPRRPTRAIMSGVAITTSKSNQPSLILATRSSSPTKSAPAAFASSALHHVQIQERVKFYQYRLAIPLLHGFVGQLFNVDVQVVSNFYSCVKFCKVSFFCKSYSFFYAVTFVLSIFQEQHEVVCFLAIFYSPCKWFNRFSSPTQCEASGFRYLIEVPLCQSASPV